MAGPDIFELLAANERALAEHRRWRRSVAAKAGWKTRRRRAELEARLSAAEANVHVWPCPECRSTQACRSDCRLAPWNLDGTAEDDDD